MLSYRHRFHAGNHADVLKHVVLLALIEALTRKPKPILYLDSHGGAGHYWLTAEATGGLAEYASGLARVAAASGRPALIERYLQAACPDAQVYHGSPLIAAASLRDGDRIVACELNAEDAERLSKSAAGRPRFSVRREDGYAALKALLPPPERRALVLIDPAYERGDEAERVQHGVQTAIARFPTGVYCVWYPLLAAREHERLLRALRATGRDQAQLTVELTVRALDHPMGLNGSGLWVLNPPFGLGDTLAALLPWLHATLAPSNTGAWRIQ